jgi:hypothetical protein
MKVPSKLAVVWEAGGLGTAAMRCGSCVKMSFYSTLKKEIQLFTTTWMSLEDMVLSEISQDQKVNIL